MSKSKSKSKSKDARIRELEAEVAELKALLARALARVAQLEKNSRTSSKPPSSDVTKPPAPTPGSAPGSGSTCEATSGATSGGGGGGGSKKRSAGGQKGHARNQRQPFTDDRIDQRFEYDFLAGQGPGENWQRLDDFYTHQQVELRDRGEKVSGTISTPHPPSPRSRPAWNQISYQLFWGLLDERLDVEWVRALSEAPEIGGVALIGPSNAPPDGLEVIAELPGKVEHGRLAAVAQAASVLVMPYIDAPVTRAMQPLKLLEYLATMQQTPHPPSPRSRPAWNQISYQYQLFPSSLSFSLSPAPPRRFRLLFRHFHAINAMKLVFFHKFHYVIGDF